MKRRELLQKCGALAAVPALGTLIACTDEATPSRDTPSSLASSSPPANAPMSPPPMGAAPPAVTTAGRAADAAATAVAGKESMPKPMGAAGSVAPATSNMAGREAPMAGKTANAGTTGAAAGATATADVPWATGGTSKMDAGNYPDPFGPDTSSCMVYPAQTLGPCYAQGPETRPDISDGQDGLPTRLSFLILDGDCKPVPNASVDIWHAGANGVYSAFAMGTICNPGRDDVRSDMFCRGVQLADEAGRVQFNTVFPGWYRGRTLHIHFTVRIEGREFMTSQLYFADALVDEILAQGSYAARGRRDTTNAGDFIFRSGGATAERVCMETAKRADGSLHAWKILSLA